MCAHARSLAPQPACRRMPLQRRTAAAGSAFRLIGTRRRASCHPARGPTRAQLKSIFRAINTPFGDDELEAVYQQVSDEDEGVVSIASFRAKLFDRL